MSAAIGSHASTPVCETDRMVAAVGTRPILRSCWEEADELGVSLMPFPDGEWVGVHSTALSLDSEAWCGLSRWPWVISVNLIPNIKRCCLFKRKGSLAKLFDLEKTCPTVPISSLTIFQLWGSQHTILQVAQLFGPLKTSPKESCS